MEMTAATMLAVVIVGSFWESVQCRDFNLEGQSDTDRISRPNMSGVQARDHSLSRVFNADHLQAEWSRGYTLATLDPGPK